MSDQPMSDQPMSKQCPNAIRDDLKAYLDHELSPVARLRVGRHLKTCAHCAKELTMLQAIQDRLTMEMPEDALSAELRGRIRAQIDTAGLTDERIRLSRTRPGLIPRRLMPLAATVSVLVTVVCLYAIIAPIREKARQAIARTDRKQISLATTQYYQDYDETFPARKTTNPSTLGMSWQTNPNHTSRQQLSIDVKTAHPDAAMDTLMETYSGSTLMADDNDLTVDEMPPRQIARLASDLQKIGTPDLAQLHRVQRIARNHPGMPLTVTIHILQEATR